MWTPHTLINLLFDTNTLIKILIPMNMYYVKTNKFIEKSAILLLKKIQK